MKEKNIKILTFNLALLDIRLFGISLVKPAKYIQERLEKIPENILSLDADILTFQEIYNKGHQELLIKAFKKDYPFYARSELFGFRMNGGLMTFSKFPIIKSRYVPFVLNTLDEMIVVQRGFLETSIEVPYFGRVHITNVHMTSGGAFFDQAAKESQYLRTIQMKQVLRRSQNKNNVIILGDFNCGPLSSPHNYNFLPSHGFIDTFVYLNKHNQYTWDTTIFLTKGGTFKNKINHRDDSIFISQDFMEKADITSSDIVFNKPILRINENDIHLSDHFGIFVILKIK